MVFAKDLEPILMRIGPNMLQQSDERCSSVSRVWRYVLTKLSGKILHKSDESLSIVTHISVNLTLE